MAVTGPNPASAVPESGFSEALIHEAEELPPGVGPYALAWRRLKRNRVALFFGVLFLVIVVLCLLAPVYSNDIAHISPSTENIVGADVNHCPPTCVGITGTPIGPTWDFSRYFLGADVNGRDVAVRLLYGGRNSLEIGAVATLITMLVGVILGVVAGYFHGLIDRVLNGVLDIIWAFPAVLLGVTLGTVLATGGILFLKGTNLMVPAVVIGFVYIPYVAKPVRGQALSLREREFVDAARQQGLSHIRIMFTEILPNLSSTIIVFIPLILANAILLEAGLTYLGAGVQPPNPSWGTMISEGIDKIPGEFHEVLVPGIMLVLAVLSINVFGDGLRDALDPRSKVRVAR